MTLEQAIAATRDPEWLNPLFAVLHARSKDSPAKTWWHAAPAHDAVFRALRLDRNEYGAFYAALPFRLARIDGQPRVLVALPCPHFLFHGDDDWLRIETVLAWDPVGDVATIMGDKTPDALIGRIPYDVEQTTIYGSPFAFFRAIAEARGQFFAHYWRVRGEWKRKPAERDETPGFLLIGSPDKVKWPLQTMPSDLACLGCDPKAINRAMLRQARIPRAHGAAHPIRKAA